MVLFCCARYDTCISRLFGSRLLVRLGEVSFSTYLLHPWILARFRFPSLTHFSSSRQAEAVFRLIIGIIFCLAISFGTYQAIEVPGRRWVRQLLGNKGRTAAMPKKGLVFACVLYLIPCLGIVFGLLAFHQQLPRLYYERAMMKEKSGDLRGANADCLLSGKLRR